MPPPSTQSQPYPSYKCFLQVASEFMRKGTWHGTLSESSLLCRLRVSAHTPWWWGKHKGALCMTRKTLGRNILCREQSPYFVADHFQLLARRGTSPPPPGSEDAASHKQLSKTSFYQPPSSPWPTTLAEPQWPQWLLLPTPTAGGPPAVP